MTRRFRTPLLAPVLALGLLAGPLAPGLGVAAAAGELDPNFGVGGVVDLAPLGLFDAQGVTVQPDGKIVVGGRTTPSGGDIAIVRLLSDGALDPSFGDGGLVLTDLYGGEDRVADLVVLDDGSILVASTTSIDDGGRYTNDFYAVTRYDAIGVLDTSFGDGGVALAEFPYAEAFELSVAADGSIYVGGTLIYPDACSTGLLDAYGNSVTFAEVTAGKIAVVTTEAATQAFVGGIARFDRDGAPIGSFGSTDTPGRRLLLCRGMASTVAALPDGSSLLGYYAPGGQGAALGSFQHYDADGNQDKEFGEPNGYGDFGGLTALAVQPADGTIVTTGSICADAAAGCDFAVARYLPDGTPDTSFAGGAVPIDLGEGEAEASALALVPDGGVVLAGGYGGQFALAKVLSDGQPDPGFGRNGVVVGGIDGRPTDIALQPDGGIVVGGHRGDGAAPTGGVVARYLGDGGGASPQPPTEPTPTPGLGAVPPDPIGPTPTPGPGPMPSNGTYTSPTHGYALEWDPSEWTVDQATSAEGVDALVLTNGVSTVLIQGAELPGDAAACRDAIVEELLTDPALEPVPDDALQGEDFSSAVYTNGQETVYVDCRRPYIAGMPDDHNVYVQVVQAVASDRYDEQVGARDDLVIDLYPRG